MPQRKIPVKDLIQFIIKVRYHASQEGEERRHLLMIRSLVNRMYLNHVGYNYRGEYRIKARDERPFPASVGRKKEYDERWRDSGGDPQSQVRVKYLGHSAFQLAGSEVIYIDPFITGNPECPLTLRAVREASAVLVTHDHGRHLGDSLAISRSTGAVLVGITGLVEGDLVPPVEFVPMNLGGVLRRDGLTIHMVPALHAGRQVPTAGYVVEFDGFVIYHAGDTAYFEGMKQIGTAFKVDLACLPVDGRFGMDVRAAAQAVEDLKPRFVVPMNHVGQGVDLDEFEYLVAENSSVRRMRPGEAFVLERGKDDAA